MSSGWGWRWEAQVAWLSKVRLVIHRWRKTAILACLSLGLVATFGTPRAYAFEIFGITLFGSDDKDASTKPGIKYDVTFDVKPANPDVEARLKGASTLANLTGRPPPDSGALKARAEADIPRMIAALFSEGHYGGTVEIDIAGRPASSLAPGAKFAKGGKPVSVVIRVKTGPQFAFGRARIAQPPAGETGPSSEADTYGIVAGEPARSGAVLDAEGKIVRAWREHGHPLARIADRKVIAEHKSRRLNVTLTVDPGPFASFGTVTVAGTEAMDNAFTRRQTGIVPGSPYTPVAVEDARERLRRLDVFESVRITESNKLTKGNRLPVAVEVTERKRRLIGGNVGWSSVDGGEVEVYWAHRNLFGEAERLRVEGTVAQFGGGPIDELKYRAAVSFFKPGVTDIDTDLFSNLTFLREHPDAYESRSITAKTGLTRRFNKQLTGSIAGEVEVSRTEDAFGTEKFTLLGIPATLDYDSRDNPLDATRGIHAALLVEPFYDVLNDNAFVLNRVDFSAYQRLDDPGRFVAAGRVALGSFYGAALDEIPANRRFFAGGGGSIRGYAYRNVGPRRSGEVVGGRSLVETSAEFRMRVTDTIGIVPFVDSGLVSEKSVPSSDVKFQVGVGVGLRYYTAIGPIRIDFGIPLNPESDDPDFAFYAGLGQVF